MKMMNSCGVQQNAEVRRNSTVVSDRRNAVICPEPLRVDVHNHHLAQSLRCQLNHQVELRESEARQEILDLILAKQDPTRPSTPRFFTGSPPRRVSNPLTKDRLFRENLLGVAPPPPPSTPQPTKPQPPPSPRSGGGCVRVTTNFGNNPAVRVVGFNCIDRDRRSSVATLA